MNRLTLTNSSAVMMLILTCALPAFGQDENDHLPIGQFVTVKGNIDAGMAGRVRNIALDLHQDAESGENKRKTILVLEIHEGTSQFGIVRDLAKFLREARVANVTTVAWVPETVTGNNVILALACDEIVMNPDAELGDIGRGKPVDQDDQGFIISLVEKKHNAKLSPALVRGMMDPQQVVVKATITRHENGQKTTETQTLTPQEVQTLRDNPDLEIMDVVRIKEQGELGAFSGTKARANGILVVQTAENRGEITDLYNLPREVLHEDLDAGDTTNVRLIKIDEAVDPVMEAFVERQIDRAIAQDSKLIIFEIEANRGLIRTSLILANRIANLDQREIRTVAYVPNYATGAAAIVALGCDEIYLHPDAEFGEISPDLLGDKEQQEIDENDQNNLNPQLEELANRKNRPIGMVQAMADPNLPVFHVTNLKTGRPSFMSDEELNNSNGEWNKGRVVTETNEGKMLLVNGERAHELQLTEAPVQDRGALKLRVGIPDNVKLTPIDRTWVDSLIFWLNTPGATFLLWVLGVACIYMELHMMTGVLGILGALCFSIFFWSRFLGGTAGWLEVVLFLLGLICLALEVFVIPGFGVFGISGGLLLFASLIMASQTFGQLEPNADFQQFTQTVGTLSASIISVIILGAFLSKYLPHIPILNEMILSPPSMGNADPNAPQLRPDAENGELALIGKQGVAASILRPAGKAEIDGKYLDVVSDGPLIDQGAKVEVVKVTGTGIVVREVT